MSNDGRFADQVAGCVLGAAIGDALGHPTEFLSMAEIKSRWGLFGVQGYELWWEREGLRFAPYTDDTQMAEMVLRGLLISRRPGFSAARDLDDTMNMIAAGFVEWAEEPQGGHRAPGNACLAGCHALARGVRWDEAGGPTAGGCGSVMRAYPFGLVFADEVETAEVLAVEHSKMTHRDPIAFAACAALAVGIARLLNNAPLDRVADAMIEAARRYSETTADMMLAATASAYSDAEPAETLDRLRGWAAHEAIAAALFVFLRHPQDPRAALLEGANTPGDSDSIASLAGALVGARCGLAALPHHWVRDVERGEELRALAAAICTDVAMERPESPRLPGVLRRTYEIEKWNGWDQELHGFVSDFRERLGIAPNIMLASEPTHRRIDLIARKGNIVDEAGDHPGEAEYAALSGFTGPGYTLDFFVDPALTDRQVSLIYDSDPDGGGEPVPDQDTEIEALAGRGRARARAAP